MLSRLGFKSGAVLAPIELVYQWHSTRQGSGLGITLPVMNVNNRIGIFTQVGYSPGSGVPSENWPAGWEQFTSIASNDLRMTLGYKLLTTDDQGITLPGLSGLTWSGCSVILLTPTPVLSSLSVGSSSRSISVNAIGAGNIPYNPFPGDDQLHFASFFGYGSLTSVGFSPAEDWGYGIATLRLNARHVGLLDANSTTISLGDGGAINAYQRAGINLIR